MEYHFFQRGLMREDTLPSAGLVVGGLWMSQPLGPMPWTAQYEYGVHTALATCAHGTPMRARHTKTCRVLDSPSASRRFLTHSNQRHNGMA